MHSEVADIVSSAAQARRAQEGPLDVQMPQTLSPQQRAVQGRDARAQYPLSQLGQYEMRHDSSIALDLIASQETARVQALLPLRHERMAESPFAFYRGSAIVMAHDLGQGGNSSLQSQLCGDAHMLNFGVFAAPDRTTVFDINDFDETHPGPFEWDLHRLLTSIVLAGEDVKMDRKAIRRAVTEAAMQYVRSIHSFAAMGEIDIWYARTTVDAIMKHVKQHRQPGLEKAISATIQESQRKSMWSAIEKFTTLGPEGRVFRNDPPILERIPMDGAIRENIYELYDHYKSTLPAYRRQLLDRYHIIDIGHKVVGVGSVGLLAFVTLLQGRAENDFIVLQSKQAVESVLEPYTRAAEFETHGERVVVGQQVMQSASDSFLGWYRGREGRSFYTRQLRDKKGSISLKTLNPEVLAAYGSLCAHVLSRAHARSGDPLVIASYLGDSEEAAEAFTTHALAYREQVHQDYRAYSQAFASRSDK